MQDRLKLYCGFCEQLNIAIAFDKEGSVWAVVLPPADPFPQEEFPGWWLALDKVGRTGALIGYNKGYDVIIHDLHNMKKIPKKAFIKAIEWVIEHPEVILED